MRSRLLEQQRGWPQPLLATLLLAWLTGSQPVNSAPQPPPPIEVFAQQVEVDLDAQTTRFQGAVKVLFEPYQARCQSATVYLDPKSRQVTKVVMAGNVVVERGQNTLKGSKVSLDVRQNRLQIEGQVYTRFQLERPVNLNLN